MSSDEAPPSKEQFRARARAEFAFLRAEYGFEEESIPLDEMPYLNRWAVWFANAKTRVVVEGINYGENSRVALGTPKAPERFEDYDLGDLIAIREPEAEAATAKRSRGGQLEQLHYFAAALKRLGEDVLRGDHSIFPAIKTRIQRRRAEFEASAEAVVDASERPSLPIWMRILKRLGFHG